MITDGDTAIDSTHLWAHSSRFGKKASSCKGRCHHPQDYSDPDAQWGAKSKDYFFFGYKVHLIVDAKSQLPLDVKVTPGGEGNSPQAKPLLKGAKERHPGIKIDSASMDSVYDAYENYRFAIEDIGATPIIALNPRSRVDAITDGSLYLSDDGTYTCVAGFKAIYWGKDKKRGRLKFRCPTALGRCQCLFRSSCSLSAYGKTFYLHPEQDYRLIGLIPRGTDPCQEKYNARTSVERAYSEEKGSHRLVNLRVRGLAQVKTHVYLALCAQVIKRIGATVTERLTRTGPMVCPVRV